MAFSPACAFALATATVVLLACLGVRNRRSGWRRSSQDDILNILLAWASARTDTFDLPELSYRTNGGIPAPAHPGGEATQNQLLALQSALKNGSVSPASTPLPGPQQKAQSTLATV